MRWLLGSKLPLCPFQARLLGLLSQFWASWGGWGPGANPSLVTDVPHPTGHGLERKAAGMARLLTERCSVVLSCAEPSPVTSTAFLRCRLLLERVVYEHKHTPAGANLINKSWWARSAQVLSWVNKTFWLPCNTPSFYFFYKNHIDFLMKVKKALAACELVLAKGILKKYPLLHYFQCI